MRRPARRWVRRRGDREEAADFREQMRRDLIEAIRRDQRALRRRRRLRGLRHALVPGLMVGAVTAGVAGGSVAIIGAGGPGDLLGRLMSREESRPATRTVPVDEGESRMVRVASAQVVRANPSTAQGPVVTIRLPSRDTTVLVDVRTVRGLLCLRLRWHSGANRRKVGVHCIVADQVARKVEKRGGFIAFLNPQVPVVVAGLAGADVSTLSVDAPTGTLLASMSRPWAPGAGRFGRLRVWAAGNRGLVDRLPRGGDRSFSPDEFTAVARRADGRLSRLSW